MTNDIPPARRQISQNFFFRATLRRSLRIFQCHGDKNTRTRVKKYRQLLIDFCDTEIESFENILGKGKQTGLSVTSKADAVKALNFLISSLSTPRFTVL